MCDIIMRSHTCMMQVYPRANGNGLAYSRGRSWIPHIGGYLTEESWNINEQKILFFHDTV